MTENQHDPHKHINSALERLKDLRLEDLQQPESTVEKENDPLWSWADENDTVESDKGRLTMEDSLKKKVHSATDGSDNKNSLIESRFSITREEEDFLIGISDGKASAGKQTGVTAKDTAQNTSGNNVDKHDSSKGDGIEKHTVGNVAEQRHDVNDTSENQLHGFSAFNEGQDGSMDNDTETESPQQYSTIIKAKRSKPASLNLIKKKPADSSPSGGNNWLQGLALLFLVVILGGGVYIYQSINQIQGQLKKINQRLDLLETGNQNTVPVKTITGASETRLLNLEQSIFDLQQKSGSLNTDQLLEQMQGDLEKMQQKLGALEGRFPTVIPEKNSKKQAGAGKGSQENNKSVIDKAPPEASPTNSNASEKTADATGTWSINLVSFPVQASALVWQTKVEAAGYRGDVQEVVINGKQWYRVRLVGLTSLVDARKLRKEVEQRLDLKKTWISKD